ncbi:hypothetical protein CRUP_010524, partial [Coryphaenoides rupestris]
GQRSSCDLCDLRMSCDCSRRGFSTVPMVTQQAVTLDLSFNVIATVTEDDLQGHATLRVLHLHGNRIAEVSGLAFSMLQMLEVLDLSQNLLATLNPSWFTKLGSLHTLNLLDNPYRVLGVPPLLQEVLSLRRLGIGGAALQELRRGDLDGVSQLQELRLNANNLQRGPVLTGPELATSLLRDISSPDTQLVLSDLILTTPESVNPFSSITSRRVRRSLSFYNLSLSDESITSFLQVTNKAPLTSVSMVNVTLTGEGRWEPAASTEHQSMDELLVRDGHLQDMYHFSSLLQLGFLLAYPRKLSLIGCKVFAMPCLTSRLLINLHFLDLSDNVLTDLALQEALCGGAGALASSPAATLADLRVLNVSGNPLQSLSVLVRLVSKLSKLTHLDVSHTGYSSMPTSCSWPSSLRHLNLSWAKLTHVGPCLPLSLEVSEWVLRVWVFQVLDLSHNDLQDLPLALPRLKQLHVSGNKLLDLPAGWRFPNLHTLTIQSNTLILFSGSDLQTFRRLHNLEAAHNKFVCSCGFVALFQTLGPGAGAGEGGLRLSDGVESYVCDSPLHLRGQLVGAVSLGPADCHPVRFVSLMCGAVLVAGVGLAVLLNRLHAFWYIHMMWAWLRAKRSSATRKRRRPEDGGATEPLFRYDAFVSYSKRDARWVEDFLVPQLEQPRPDPEEEEEEEEIHAPLSLCLHERDFLPGPWVVDNVVSAMETSRRTIFVLSEHFFHSDWCRHEFHLSHLRLSEGRAGAQDDVLVVLGALRTEDVPKRFCRLRRLMGSNTYLEWPQEEGQRRDFWRKLRNAVGEE